jgi:hypothetical protein
MRRVLPSSSPRDEFLPAGRRIVSAAEQAHREAFIENLVINHIPQNRIISLARAPSGPLVDEAGHPAFGKLYDGRLPGLGIGTVACKNLIQIVLARLNKEFEDSRPNNKALATTRLYRHVQNAARRGAFGAVVSAERLIADIEGTREPMRLEIGVSIQGALMSVIGGMSEKHFKALVTEWDELEAKANDGSKVLVQLPRSEHHVWEVQGTQEYLVVEHDGVWTCNCPDFRFRGAERPCKHVLRCQEPQTGLRRNGVNH